MLQSAARHMLRWGVQLSFNFVVIAETEHSSAEEVTQCTNNFRLFNVASEIRHNLGAILSDIVLMVNFWCDCLRNLLTSGKKTQVQLVFGA